MHQGRIICERMIPDSSGIHIVDKDCLAFAHHTQSDLWYGGQVVSAHPHMGWPETPKLFPEVMGGEKEPDQVIIVYEKYTGFPESEQRQLLRDGMRPLMVQLVRPGESVKWQYASCIATIGRLLVYTYEPGSDYVG